MTGDRTVSSVIGADMKARTQSVLGSVEDTSKYTLCPRVGSGPLWRSGLPADSRRLSSDARPAVPLLPHMYTLVKKEKKKKHFVEGRLPDSRFCKAEDPSHHGGRRKQATVDRVEGGEEGAGKSGKRELGEIHAAKICIDASTRIRSPLNSMR
ncbi:hypothetical protein ISCGN_025606 [Ixodes scapularis]